MVEIWPFFGILLQIICGLVGGACSFLLLNWGLTRAYLGLEYRLSDLEGRVTREVKVRASEASRSTKNWEREMIDKLAGEEIKPKLDIKSWRTGKYKGE